MIATSPDPLGGSGVPSLVCNVRSTSQIAVDLKGGVVATTFVSQGVVTITVPGDEQRFGAGLCINVAGADPKPFRKVVQLVGGSVGINNAGKVVVPVSVAGLPGTFAAYVDPSQPNAVTVLATHRLEPIFTIGMDGTYYSTDGSIVRVTQPSGVSVILAGVSAGPNVATVPADGIGTAARFSKITGIAVNAQGEVYVADNGTAIRKVSSAGVVTTLVGSLLEEGALDGTGSLARFDGLHSVVVDRAGNIYASDTGNTTIRKITPQGVVTTVAGQLRYVGYFFASLPGLIGHPRALAIDAADMLYVVVTPLPNEPFGDVQILKIKF